MKKFLLLGTLLLAPAIAFAEASNKQFCDAMVTIVRSIASDNLNGASRSQLVGVIHQNKLDPAVANMLEDLVDMIRESDITPMQAEAAVRNTDMCKGAK